MHRSHRSWRPVALALLALSCARTDGEIRIASDSLMDPRSMTSEPIRADRLFRTHCATCHLGGGGLLGAPRTPDLFEDALIRGESAPAILQAIRYGIDPPRMPSFERGLDEDEMRSLTAYILERRHAHEASQSHGGTHEIR